MTQIEQFNFLLESNPLGAAGFAFGCAKGCKSLSNYNWWISAAVQATNKHSIILGNSVELALGNTKWGNIDAAQAILSKA